MDIERNASRIKYSVFIESLNLIGLSGLFLFSLLFFNFKFSKFEIAICIYIGILLLSGIFGLFAVIYKSKIISKIYIYNVFLCLLSSILFCALCVYLIIDILFVGNRNCDEITLDECKGIFVYFMLVFLLLYLIIFISII